MGLRVELTRYLHLLICVLAGNGMSLTVLAGTYKSQVWDHTGQVFMGDFQWGSLDLNPRHRKDHRIHSLTLEDM